MLPDDPNVAAQLDALYMEMGEMGKMGETGETAATGRTKNGSRPEAP
jgi:hypothetical protein